MKSFLFLALMLPALAGQTQLEMNDAACGAFHKADTELNNLCNHILTANKGDADFVHSFYAAQDAWRTFRDAQIKALYPNPNPMAAYGSVNTMCRCSELEQLTKDRIAQVRTLWITGTSEGDACRGSRPVQPKSN